MFMVIMGSSTYSNERISNVRLACMRFLRKVSSESAQESIVVKKVHKIVNLTGNFFLP